MCLLISLCVIREKGKGQALGPTLHLGYRTTQQSARKITQEKICTIKLQMKHWPGHSLYQLLCSASCLKGTRNHEVGKSIKILPEDNK